MNIYIERKEIQMAIFDKEKREMVLFLKERADPIPFKDFPLDVLEEIEKEYFSGLDIIRISSSSVIEGGIN